MRPKYEIVLRAMQAGQEIVFPDGFTRSIVNGKLADLIKMWEGGVDALTGPPTKEWWAESEMSVSWLIAECEKMSDDEVALIAANTTLRIVKP